MDRFTVECDLYEAIEAMRGADTTDVVKAIWPIVAMYARSQSAEAVRAQAGEAEAAA